MQETLIGSFIQVFAGYWFLMLVWPQVVFRRILRGKSDTFQFGFCTMGTILLWSTVILTAGVFGILNRWVILALFYGSFLVMLVRNFNLRPSKFRLVYMLIVGTCKPKTFLRRVLSGSAAGLRRHRASFVQARRRQLMVYGLLILCIVYGWMYFTYGAFQLREYGCGDMYVHHSWIYGLTNGEAFCEGVYPEGMHCMVYLINILFGAKLYFANLFLGPIHTAIFFVSAYCLLKECFRWRYTPIFALVLYLTIGLSAANAIYGITRLQWTLPLEYGLFTVLLCPLYLLRYLRKQAGVTNKTPIGWREQLKHPDEDLILFLFAVSASLVIHFYATIMAVFTCITVAVCFLRRVFKKRTFVSLAAACLAAFALATAPMGAALATGNQFQGSMNWAMSVIEGDERENNGRVEAEEEPQTAEVPQTRQTQAGQAASVEGSFSETGNTEQAAPQVTMGMRLAAAKELLLGKLVTWYQWSYQGLYHEAAPYLVLITGAAAILCLTGLLRKWEAARGYWILLLGALLFCLLYAAPGIGLVELMAGVRLFSTLHLLLISVVLVPLDWVAALLLRRADRLRYGWIPAGGLVLMTMAVVLTGNYHSYLYYGLFCYPENVEITERITEEYPTNAFTVVSPVDELYQVIQYGRHTELYELMLAQNEPEPYRLPTEYVFVYVEKKPLLYGQVHFLSGPAWLGGEDYISLYSPEESSLHPDVVCTEISEDMVREILPNLNGVIYTWLDMRTAVESTLYDWCQRFSETYPNEMQVYAETDNVIIYCFRQTPGREFDLNLGGIEQ